MIESADNTTGTPVADPTDPSAEFLKLAQRAHEQSESFLEASQMQRWRRNYSRAQSEHPDGSKYLSAAYQNRSRHFRGKTEASIRKNEAAMAVALFSNHDVVSIRATNGASETTAEILHKLVNNQLDESVKWFMISLGAYHEAMIAGNVVSKNYWKYDRDADGTVHEDQMAIDLVPLENCKISPQANWIDPINTSPYWIVEWPMFIYDIKERMKADWIEYSEQQIQAACVKFKQNNMKSARQGREQTAAEDAAKSAVTDFDYVYVHENFIKRDGKDWFFYTLGKELILSEPIPVREAFPHLKPRKRPYTWGTITIEPHKVYRRSLVDRVASAQDLSNEIGNLRVDNVKQVLNKRKYVQRFMGVDYQALKSSVPGGMVLMDDINAVKPEDTIDVTGSSYQEQAVINSDFDELSGTFSASSVATNRQLNETVGGMTLLEGNANTLTEYQLRVLVETWVEPVLIDAVDMVKFYEDDAKIQEVLGDPSVTNESLQASVKVRADVGFGSTDPNGKVQKLMAGVSTTMQLPQAAAKLDQVAVAREIYSILGFNDGKKFLPDDAEQPEDPRVAELTAVVQQLQQVIQTKQVEGQQQMQLEVQRGKNRLTEAVVKTTNDRQIRLTEMALNRGIKLKELEAKTGVDSGKINLEYLKEINRRQDVANQQKELNYKIQTGNEGI